MPEKIIWSPLAEKDFADILEYLDKEWGWKIANQFIDLLEQVLEQISINPKQFPVIFRKKKIRKCVLTKYNTLYYRFGKDRIDILRIYDRRQDPEKLGLK